MTANWCMNLTFDIHADSDWQPTRSLIILFCSVCTGGLYRLSVCVRSWAAVCISLHTYKCLCSLDTPALFLYFAFDNYKRKKKKKKNDIILLYMCWKWDRAARREDRRDTAREILSPPSRYHIKVVSSSRTRHVVQQKERQQICRITQSSSSSWTWDACNMHCWQWGC